MKGKNLNCQELKTTTLSEFNEQKLSTLASELGRTWRRLIESLFGMSEPKIYSLKSKSGNAYWVVQDPIAGRRAFFDSEQEVRTWLDKRYYR